MIQHMQVMMQQMLQMQQQMIMPNALTVQLVCLIPTLIGNYSSTHGGIQLHSMWHLLHSIFKMTTVLLQSRKFYQNLSGISQTSAWETGNWQIEDQWTLNTGDSMVHHTPSFPTHQWNWIVIALQPLQYHILSGTAPNSQNCNELYTPEWMYLSQSYEVSRTHWTKTLW